MTSSLVGSEMCIRDRDRVAAVWRQMHAHHGLWCKKTAPPVLTACVGPVSYTHLTLPTICSV
eukprot:9978182-Prorocentrum_lima.AAC.1